MKKRIIASILSFAFISSAVLSDSMPCFSGVSAEDNAVKYEFEDGKTSGGKIYNETWKGNTEEDGSGEDYDLTNASGGGFSYLDQKGTTVSVDVTVEEAGLYELSICYCEPYDPNKKVQYLNVNGVNQGEVSFQHNLTFEEISGGVVMLDEGVNTIELGAYWGYTMFDYLTIKPADESLKNLSPTRQLSNKNASDSTKRLYNYLCDQYGKHIISGQQEYCGQHNYNLYADPNNYIKDNEQEFEYLMDKTGKMCALRGIDFLNYRSNPLYDDNAAERTIQWVNEYGGIAAIVWHWSVPSEEGSTDCNFYVESASANYTTFSISKALEEGTWEHEVLLADIEEIARQLKKLKDADVPVLWRPLHEAEGGWFWWGAEGAEPCKELYRLLYDKLTNEYGLDNLIWVWTGYSYQSSADWYPGDDVVDIIGYDKYNAVDGKPNLSSISSTFYSLVKSTDGQKMVAMSENDSIPSLENLTKDKAGWLYFCPWYMNYLTSEQNNPVENLVEIYNSEYCITLDELPDLKKYPLPDEEPEVTETVQTEETSSSSSANSDSDNSDVMLGDVTADGNIDVRDVTMLAQYIVKLTGLDEKQFANADVTKDGIADVKDLSQIKKYLINELKAF